MEEGIISFQLRSLITRKFCVCNFEQSITHHILRSVMHWHICDALTRLPHLLKMGSLVYQNPKLHCKNDTLNLVDIGLSMSNCTISWKLLGVMRNITLMLNFHFEANRKFVCTLEQRKISPRSKIHFLECKCCGDLGLLRFHSQKKIVESYSFMRHTQNLMSPSYTSISSIFFWEDVLFSSICEINKFDDLPLNSVQNSCRTFASNLFFIIISGFLHRKQIFLDKEHIFVVVDFTTISHW